MNNRKMFQTLTFRLNLNHKEDAEVWKMIRNTEENSTIFENRSDFIRFILLTAAENFNELNNAKEDIRSLKDAFVQEINEYWMETVRKLIDDNLEKLGTIVEIAVNKAMVSALSGLIAGGTVTSDVTANRIMTEKENYENEQTMEKTESAMGVLPETDKNEELPDGALEFLDSL